MNVTWLLLLLVFLLLFLGFISRPFLFQHTTKQEQQQQQRKASARIPSQQ
jgi:hypothetical protein